MYLLVKRGYSLISFRSSSGGNPEEDEEGDSEGEESDQEGRDYSWKKTIMIGPSFQASVPGGEFHFQIVFFFMVLIFQPFIF